jgi:hypothetical protein
VHFISILHWRLHELWIHCRRHQFGGSVHENPMPATVLLHSPYSPAKSCPYSQSFLCTDNSNSDCISYRQSNCSPLHPPSYHLSQNFGQLEYTGSFSQYLSLESSGGLASATTTYNGISTSYGYACYQRSLTLITSGNYGCSMYKYYPSLGVGYCYVGYTDANCNAATYSNTGVSSDYVFTSRYVYF